MAAKAAAPSPSGRPAVVVSYKDVYRVPDGLDSFDEDRRGFGRLSPTTDRHPLTAAGAASSCDPSGSFRADHDRYDDSGEVYMSAASGQSPLPTVLRSRIYTPGSALLTKDRGDADSASAWLAGGHRAGDRWGASGAVAQGDEFEFRRAAGGKDRGKAWPRWRRMADSVQSVGTEGMKSCQTRSFKTLHKSKSEIDLGDMQRALEDGGFLHVKFGWRAMEGEDPPEEPPAVTYEECEGRKGKRGERGRRGLWLLRALRRSDGKGEDRGGKAAAKGQAPMCMSCLWRRPETFESSLSSADPVDNASAVSAAPCAAPPASIASSPLSTPPPHSPPSLIPIAPASSATSNSAPATWRNSGSEVADVAEQDESGLAGLNGIPSRRCSSGPEISLSLDVDVASRATSGSFDGWEVLPSLRGGAPTLAHRWKPPVFKTDAQYAARQAAFQSRGAQGRICEVWPQVEDSRAVNPMSLFTKVQSFDVSTKQSLECSTWDDFSIPDWGFFDAGRMHTLEPDDSVKRSLSSADFGLQASVLPLCSRE
eukprot:evm.model.scf_202.4 EVM.evm.TU.scf_202.4   scf_202:30856-34383(-)